jgi:hypothetical protein
MKRTKLLLIVFLLTCLGTVTVAQSTIPASGGNASGTGGSVSYTVGQTTYKSITGTNGSVSQGVQQPYEISVVTAVEDAIDINLVCSVYPNPTADFLTLKVADYESSQLTYLLYGINGNLIETKKILGFETSINMQNQSRGTYFLKISSENKDIKTFKIIKN